MDQFRKTVEFDGICINPNMQGKRYFSERSVTDLFSPKSCLIQNIASGRVMGEWGRPEGLDSLTGIALLKRQLAIELDNVCFRIVEMGFDIRATDDMRYVYPQAVLDYCGPKAQELILNIDNVVFKPRMLIDQGGAIHTISRIITWDAVLTT